ncbi:MAG: transcription elongation factor GreA [Patescibacteria group bacterium]
MNKENYLTPGGLEKLKKELKRLEVEERGKLAVKLKKAISYGDLSENAAYSEAKDEQGFLEGKILELKGIINTARIVVKRTSSIVRLGSNVVVSIGDAKFDFEIVGESEADIMKNKISHRSPLGEALMGKKVGDKVRINVGERIIVYTILEVK